MGVKGTHLFLKRQGLIPEVLSCPLIENATKIHVDLLGSYYPLITNSFAKYESNVAAKMVMKVLATKFTQESTIFYLDGNRTKEKEGTAALRQKTKDKNLKTMEELLRKAESKIENSSRVSGSQLKSIDRLCRRAFNLTSDMKAILAKAATHTGWEVINCLGEADVHIGGLCLTDTDVVVSGDSDMLFYGTVQHVLRPMKRVFYYYSRPIITKLLNLTNIQWTAIGIVSGNDYAANIPGYGIAKNCQIIRSLSQTTVADIIVAYVKIVDSKSSSQFDVAQQIFVSHKEELVEYQVGSQLVTWQTLNTRFNILRKSARDSRKARRNKEREIPELKYRQKWRMNRSRPMEQKLTLSNNCLSRYSYKQFNEFKKLVDLDSGFKMYHVNPDNRPANRKSKKELKKRVKATRSYRSLRKEITKPPTSRLMKQSRRDIFALRKAHPKVTLDVGSLLPNIYRALADKDLAVVVSDTIRYMVKVMNEAKSLCQLATELLVIYIMQQYPSQNSECNAARSKLLRPLIYGSDGGKLYHQQLLRIALKGSDEVINVGTLMRNYVSVNAVQDKKMLPKIAFQLLKEQFPEANAINTKKLNLGRILEMISSVMDTELASHIKGRLPMLQEKALSNGQKLAETADAMDDISIFHFTNLLLPPTQRFSLSPQSGYKDSYIDITEEGLLMALQPDHKLRLYLKNVFQLQSAQFTVRQLTEAANAQKGLTVGKLLFRLNMHEADARLRSKTHGYRATAGPLYSGKRYVLEGTFRTNGQNLQLLALDSAKQKTKRVEKSKEGVDQLLPNIEDVFPDTGSVEQTFVDPKKVTIVGIDLGEVCTVAACCINFSDTSAVRNLAIKRQALYQPTLITRNMIEEVKPAAVSLCESQSPGRNDYSYDQVCQYAKQVLTAWPTARSFYGTALFKRLLHDQKKARRGEFDVATNAVLRMVGGHIGRKREAHEDVVFAFGLGHFNTRKKLSSLHTSFSSHLITKLRSLNYIVVGVEEFYTSKKCPCCQKFVGQITMRRLYCPSCKKAYHRDVMASHNIAKIAEKQLLEFRRPAYLCSVSSSSQKRNRTFSHLDEGTSKRLKLPE